MSRMECRHESEILDAVASGRWPERADEALRKHASSCRICTDVGMISALYHKDYARTLEATIIPSAGLVWWKSELRARREAVRMASRPIAIAVWVAAACVAGVLVALLRGFAGDFNMASVSAFILAQPLVLWLLLGAIVALTPLALYFVYSDE